MTSSLPAAAWRTSSYSNIGGNCVEVAVNGSAVGVRDTRDRVGVMLAFSPQAWRLFAARAKSMKG